MQNRAFGVLAVSLLGLAGCQGADPPAPAPVAPTVATLRDAHALGFVEWSGSGAVSWVGADHVAYGTDAGDVYVSPLDGSSKTLLGNVPVGVLELTSDPAGRLITAAGLEDIITWTADGRVVRHDQLGFGDVGALAYADDASFEVHGSDVVSTYTFDRGVTSPGTPAPHDRGYLDVKVDGKQVIAWPSDENDVDIWDIAGARPVLAQRQSCGCDAGHRAAVSGQAPLVAMAPDDGSLVIWDYRNNSRYARKLVARSARDDVSPLAMLGDNLVLFTMPERGRDPRPASPLFAWNVRADSIVELWDGAGGEVTTIWPGGSGDSVLMEVSDRGGTASPVVWIGSVRDP